MKVLSQQEVSQVSGGESLIDAIHRAEYNSYGVPLINAGIFAINLFSTTKIPYVTKKEAP
ncbi:hypothetical protein [Aquabacterium sp.]|uniref:hypothetical protein n=1 Tax=Aquabacterium sp. TaxID=1872578 RepID=UPI003D6D1EC5